jgi:hypothetical protein
MLVNGRVKETLDCLLAADDIVAVLEHGREGLLGRASGETDADAVHESNEPETLLRVVHLDETGNRVVVADEEVAVEMEMVAVKVDAVLHEQADILAMCADEALVLLGLPPPVRMMDDDGVSLFLDGAEDKFLAETYAGDYGLDFRIRVALGVNQEAGLAVVFDGTVFVVAFEDDKPI